MIFQFKCLKFIFLSNPQESRGGNTLSDESDLLGLGDAQNERLVEARRVFFLTPESDEWTQ